VGSGDDDPAVLSTWEGGEKIRCSSSISRGVKGSLNLPDASRSARASAVDRVLSPHFWRRSVSVLISASPPPWAGCEEPSLIDWLVVR